MSTKVKQEAARIDDLIKANAAAARGEEADVLASPESADEESSEPVLAEVTPITEEQEPEPEEPAAFEGGELAELRQELSAARQEAEQATQRWRSLDGSLRAKDEQIDRLTDLVSKMTQGAEQAPQPQQPAAPVGVIATDTDNFGDDMIDFVTRIATAVMQQAVGGLQTKVETITQDVETVSRNTAKVVSDSFETQLTKLCPRWREFDTADAFHTWLGESQSRHSRFSSAAAEQDAVTVSDYFNQFILTHITPNESAKQTKDDGKKDKLERQVAPGKARSTASKAADTPQGKRMWTRSEIAQAYSDKSKGKYTSDEWNALEREMSIAQAEERVDYTR